MWDWEGWAVGAKKINRPNLPAVFRCGEIGRPTAAPFVDLTKEWQFFWFDLCCWVCFGRYHDDLTDDEYKWMARKWTSVGDGARAFTNQHGLEKFRNFVTDERPQRKLPKIQALVCGGASLAGTPVQGQKNMWMLKVAHFDANRTPPDVRTIDPYADPRVFFATTIAYNENPGYSLTFDAKSGPPEKKKLVINKAFAIGRFPQFDMGEFLETESRLLDCPIPIIAAQDIYYPMRYLVPITDGKKANPYYPPKPYSGFGSPQS
jgi:hypothetical protein